MLHVDINSYGKQQSTLFYPIRLWEQVHIRRNNIDYDSGTKKDNTSCTGCSLYVRNNDIHRYVYGWCVIEYKAALNHTSCQLNGAAMEELLPR